MFERRLFGKTDDEILRALEFYDKHSEQAVKDDLTRSEAVTKIRELTHSNWTERDIVDFVDCLAGLGVLKLKKEKKNSLEDYLTVSSVVRDQIKTVFIHNSLIEHIGDKLRKACMTRFGDCWSNDTANLFARIAIEEYELQKAKDNK